MAASPSELRLESLVESSRRRFESARERWLPLPLPPPAAAVAPTPPPPPPSREDNTEDIAEATVGVEAEAEGAAADEVPPLATTRRDIDPLLVLRRRPAVVAVGVTRLLLRSNKERRSPLPRAGRTGLEEVDESAEWRP